MVLVQSPPLDQQLAPVQEKDGKGPVEQPLSVGFLLFHPAHRAVRLIYQDHIRHRRRSLPKSRAKASSIVPSKGSCVNLPGRKTGRIPAVDRREGFVLDYTGKIHPTGGNDVKTVTIYTDGACSGNPGPGGWGTILLYGEHRKEMSGGEPDTTNNRMELTAVIRGLEALKEPCQVELYSDSKYVIDALEKGWARSWKARGWVKGDKKPALNPDLWEQLLALCDYHQVNLHWVKGHAENPYNNRCDELAVAEWQKMK